MRHCAVVVFLVFTWTGLGAQKQSELKGLTWEDDRYHSLPIKINYSKLSTDLPSSFSLKMYCPKVVNQGGTNTAVSWAAVWYARTMLEGAACDRKDVNANTEESFNNFFNNRLVVKDCNEPVSLIDILTTLQLEGAKKFKEFKTFCLDTIPPETLEEAKTHRISGFVRLFNVFDLKETKVNAIKAALISKDPVVVGVIPPATFGEIQDYWQPRGSPIKGTGGHALCVVGYDDTKYGGAFEVVNSWGKTWGHGGYTWIRYEEVKDFILYGFELFDSEYNPCVEKSASASLKFKKTDGMEMRALPLKPGFYKMDAAYPPKTEFKVAVRTTGKMYAYGIFADPANVIAPFFPWAGENIANAVPFQEYEFELPLGNFPFTLEPPNGSNYLAFLFSSNPVDVAEVVKQLTKARGDFQQRLKSTFKTRSHGQSIQWQSELKFNVEFDEEMFVVMVVQLDQR